MAGGELTSAERSIVASAAAAASRQTVLAREPAYYLLYELSRHIIYRTSYHDILVIKAYCLSWHIIYRLYHGISSIMAC